MSVRSVPKSAPSRGTLHGPALTFAQNLASAPIDVDYKKTPLHNNRGTLVVATAKFDEISLGMNKALDSMATLRASHNKSDPTGVARWNPNEVVDDDGPRSESRSTLTDENDPIFLIVAKVAISNELATLVDPPDPSAAYNAQQQFRANRFDAGMYMYSEEDTIPQPSVMDVHTYALTIRVLAERRERLNANLAKVEEKMQDAMSPALKQVYLNMLK